jgi:hypothetical protein
MTTKEHVNPYRTTARVVGVVYLAGFVVGLVGIGLFQSILGAPNYLSTLSADTRSFCAGWCRQSWGRVWVIFPRTQAACGRWSWGYG